MGVPHSSETKINVHGAKFREIRGKTLQERKFNTSIERRIEQLSYKSETLGWSFTEFCVHVLEVLAVLQHRKKIRQIVTSRQSTGKAIDA
jgi:hypothetical protein